MKLKFMKIIAIIAMLGTIFLFTDCELEGTDTGSDTISPKQLTELSSSYSLPYCTYNSRYSFIISSYRRYINRF